MDNGQAFGAALKQRIASVEQAEEFHRKREERSELVGMRVLTAGAVLAGMAIVHLAFVH